MTAITKIKINAILILLVFFVMLGTANCQKNAALTFADVARDNALVQARVITVSEQKSTYTATIQIEQVYCGPENLQGTTLAVTSTLQPDFQGYSVLPRLKVGEQGIWAESRFQEGPWHNKPRNLFAFISPSRQGLDPDYLKTVALAKIVSQVCKADPAKQMQLLRVNANKADSYATRWSMETLSLIDPAGSTLMFQKMLASGDRPISQQLLIDELLWEENGQKWLLSPKRVVVLERWAGSRFLQSEAENVLYMIKKAADDGQIDRKTYFHLLAVIAHNPDIPLSPHKKVMLDELSTKKVFSSGLPPFAASVRPSMF